jgi:glycosyltransferase involved in cell wall biosynthesis
VRVSVVIPCLSPAPYVVEAIRSVLEESPDTEVVVQDGGSSPASLELLGPFRSSIAFESARDSGQSQALNRGIARATGDIIGWLNADDYYLPGWRAALEAGLAANPTAELLYGDFNIVDSNGETLRRYEVSEYQRSRLLRRRCYLFSGATFFRKSAFERCGLFREDLHYCMDYEMFLRLSDKVDAAKLPYPCGVLRIHNQSKTGSRSSGFRRESNSLIREYMPGAGGRALAVARGTEQTLLQLLQPLRYGRVWSRLRPAKRL